MLYTLCLLNTSSSYAKSPKSPLQLSPAEAQGRIQHLRTHWNPKTGSYCFQFELKYLPKRGQDIKFRGTLWRKCTPNGQVSRTRISNASGQIWADILTDQRGTQSKNWLAQSTAPQTRQLNDKEIHQEILPKTLYTPFDLQMPFIEWPESYLYSKRLRGQSTHAFKMSQDQKTLTHPQAVDHVILHISPNYNSIVRTEYFAPNQKLLKTMEFVGYKKFEDQYIFKSAKLIDQASKDRAQFKILHAVIESEIPDSYFQIESLGQATIHPYSTPQAKSKKP